VAALRVPAPATWCRLKRCTESARWAAGGALHVAARTGELNPRGVHLDLADAELEYQGNDGVGGQPHRSFSRHRGVSDRGQGN